VWKHGKRKNMLAHRAVYELHFGDIPNGMFVLHKCDNPSCVNIDHLELGDQKKNVQDCIARGRRVINRGRAKISFAVADRIRRSRKRGVELAKLYGLSKASISEIRHGKTWRR
jgi:hypothetical protein